MSSHEQREASGGGFFGGLFDPIFSLFDWLSGPSEGTGTPPPVGPGGGTPAETAPVVEPWVDQGPPRPPPDPSVVYLGLNDASRGAERKAFNGVDNAVVIDGAGDNAAMQGKTMAADGETVLDLSKPEHVQQFLTETGVGGLRRGADGRPIETEEDAAARMSTMQNLFLGTENADGVREGGLTEGSRDEMADFVRVLQQVEQGDMAMDRLVMSGHSTGDWIYSEAEGSPGVTFEQMTTMFQQFPQAQAGVNDLMLSACHTLEDGDVMDNRDGAQYQQMLPNLDSVWGYDGFSPSYKQGSVNHVRNWLAASGDSDSSKISRAARRSGQNATVKTFD